MQCTVCKTNLKPLLFSWYCPNDCDKKREVKTTEINQVQFQPSGYYRLTVNGESFELWKNPITNKSFNGLSPLSGKWAGMWVPPNQGEKYYKDIIAADWKSGGSWPAYMPSNTKAIHDVSNFNTRWLVLGKEP